MIEHPWFESICWHNNDFIVWKVDVKNGFDMVSRQVLLSECSIHFPELLPWASWCYSQHPIMWHPVRSLHVWSLLFGPEPPSVTMCLHWRLCCPCATTPGIWTMVCWQVPGVLFSEPSASLKTMVLPAMPVVLHLQQ